MHSKPRKVLIVYLRSDYPGKTPEIEQRLIESIQRCFPHCTIEYIKKRISYLIIHNDLNHFDKEMVSLVQVNSTRPFGCSVRVRFVKKLPIRRKLLQLLTKRSLTLRERSP